MKQVTEAVNIIKQLSGFSQFGELESIINRLDAHVSAICHKSTPVIFFDKNDSLKGLDYLTPIHQAILDKKVLNIKYKSFKALLPEFISFNLYTEGVQQPLVRRWKENRQKPVAKPGT